MDSPTTFRILTVCTGNICRSPAAERLLQSGLDERFPGRFAVSSAGVQALVGEPMQAPSAEIVDAAGGNSGGFAARKLTFELLRSADLVLAMDGTHRRSILELAPAKLKKTFTVREFARMLAALDPSTLPSDPVELWTALPAAAAAVRHQVLPTHPDDDDVADPFRRGPEAYSRMAAELLPAIDTLVQFGGAR